MTIYQKALLAKIETTKGTDSVPVAATNGVRVERGYAPVPAVEKIPYDPVKATMGALKSLVGRKTITIDAPTLVRGSGAAGTAPEIGALLQACGLVETVAAGTSVTYAPTTTAASLKSVSTYNYIDGILMKALGAVGTCVFDCQINAPIAANFSLSAGFDTAPTTTASVTPTFSAVQPIVMSSADVISDGATIKVGAFSFDLGNEIGDHYTTSQNEFTVANRKPTIKITKDSLSTVADWNALVNATELSLSAVFGATSGNTMTITASKAVPTANTLAERNERQTKEIVFELIETTGDDQFSVAFT